MYLRHRSLFNVHVGVLVFVCVCVRVCERERKGENLLSPHLNHWIPLVFFVVVFICYMTILYGAFEFYKCSTSF